MGKGVSRTQRVRSDSHGVLPLDHGNPFTNSSIRYTWNVMPFGLSDAPPHFQSFINHILFEKLGKRVLVYLDDIIVLGDTKQVCLENAKWILQKLRENKLFCKITKCEFFPNLVTCLGCSIENGAYLPKNLRLLIFRLVT